MQFSPRDSSRAVLGALLQTGWGVAPTHTTYSTHLNDTEQDYLWSSSDTPFGYLSSSKRLSFALRDAAARNVLLTDFNRTLSELSGLFTQFQTYGKEIEEVLSPEDHLGFVRRWNIFKFKLTKTHHMMSLNQFNQSLFYIRSSQHDIDAMHHFLHTGMEALTPVMRCGRAPFFFDMLMPYVESILLAGAVLLWCVLISDWGREGVKSLVAGSWLGPYLGMGRNKKRYRFD